MATAMQKAQAKFKKGQNVKFTLGRGGDYKGKIKDKDNDGYLYVAFHGNRAATAESTFYRRISPFNAKLVRA